MLLWVLQKGRQEEEQGWRGQERACGSLTAAQCRTKQSVAGAARQLGNPGEEREGSCNQPDFHHLPLTLLCLPTSKTFVPDSQGPG